MIKANLNRLKGFDSSPIFITIASVFEALKEQREITLKMQNKRAEQ
jgi:hypothetical protein